MKKLINFIPVLFLCAIVLLAGHAVYAKAGRCQMVDPIHGQLVWPEGCHQASLYINGSVGYGSGARRLPLAEDVPLGATLTATWGPNPTGNWTLDSWADGYGSTQYYEKNRGRWVYNPENGVMKAEGDPSSWHPMTRIQSNKIKVDGKWIRVWEVKKERDVVRWNGGN